MKVVMIRPLLALSLIALSSTAFAILDGDNDQGINFLLAFLYSFLANTFQVPYLAVTIRDILQKREESIANHVCPKMCPQGPQVRAKRVI
jgi:hypothetical protein